MGVEIGDKVQFRTGSGEPSEPVGTILEQAASGAQRFKVEFPGFIPMWYDITELALFSRCFHQWREYDGFREKYQYCTKCDEKRHDG